MAGTFNLKREVRFGAVLYGGVSLCVYMNGIAQELLHLVKSTAPSRGNPDVPFLANPTATQAVYRRLGQFLAHPDRPTTLAAITPDTDIHTRFLIDAIAGTSAGGINGVFLAKALALEGDLTSLKDLWKDEGDISKLINDKGSMVDELKRYELQDPPTSLLNSQRMYFELLKALRGMDPKPAPATRESALVDELDLHITATDLRGLVLPIQLSDGQIFERRHRTSFHFRHSPLTSTYQFTEEYTPFLAFAARCTSSFPVAFEPMQFADIDDTLRREGILMRDAAAASSSERYRPFYPDYTPESLLATGVPQLEFEHRAFADGGYLDNKPFSFVIDEILKRQGTLPIDRKLLYLEPHPDTPEQDRIEIRRPNALANAWMALSSLPRYETIRQDLERALERNREIERLRDLLYKIESAAFLVDSSTPEAAAGAAPTLSAGEWERLDTHDLARAYGRSYIAYHRIKVATVTNGLTELLCDYFRVNPDSVYGHKLRFLVEAWRDMAYGPTKAEGGQPAKQDQLNRFLLDFDIRYRLRRLHHLFRKIDETARDPSRLHLASSPDASIIRRGLTKPLNDLERLRRNHPIKVLAPLGTLEHLSKALGMSMAETVTDELKLGAAQSYEDAARWSSQCLSDPGIADAIGAAAAALAAEYKTAFTRAHDDVAATLRTDAADTSEGAALRRELDRESKLFERHDVLTFPLLYNSNLGELDPIEIFRVSPKDAPIGARYASADKPKVKGAALGAFAGFLEREWRENDILWGRLDGAERIVTALLPEAHQNDVRNELIRDAHLAIVEEELANHPKIRNLPVSGMERLSSWMTLRLEQQQRKPWASTLARGTTVIGDILESIARRQNSQPTPLSAIPHVGRLAWGLVEVATPRSFNELLFRYWLSVIFALGILLVLLGILIPAVQTAGWALVGISAASKIATGALQDYFQEDPARKHRPTLATLSALLVAAAIPLALFFSAIGIGHATAAPLPPWTTRFLFTSSSIAGLVAFFFMVRVALASRGVPVQSIEDWKTAAQVERDAGDIRDPRRAAIRTHLRADGCFVAAYALLFGLLGLTMLRTGDPLPAVGLLAFGLAAALADYLENERISRNVCSTLRELGTGDLDLPVAPMSTAKWALFSGTLPLAAWWLLSHNHPSSLFALTAAYAFMGSFVCRVLGAASGEGGLNKLSLLLLAPALPALATYLLGQALR